MLKKIKTSLLEMAYLERGDQAGAPVILMHGFPDDAHTFDRTSEQLAANGFRTFAPFTRGYGETRFLDEATMRSGEGAAYAQDIIEFADALGLEKFIFVGHDWGAIAGYLLGVLYPNRLRALVTASVEYESALPSAYDLPITVEQMRHYWYQWLFNTSRGAEKFGVRTDELCRELWKSFSPGWDFAEAEFAATADSWKNPDFHSLIIHGYRFRWRNAAGDARYKKFLPALQGEPLIDVPTIVLHGVADGASLAASSVGQERHFTNYYERIALENVGHFVPREQPEAIVEAVLKLAKQEQQAKNE